MPIFDRIRSMLGKPPSRPHWSLPPPDRRSWRQHPMGINIVGYLNAEMGIGESARSTIRAAQAAGVPFSLVDFRLGARSRMTETLDDRLPRGRRYAVNLLHINADQTLLAAATLGRDFFADRYNVWHWLWELPEFPHRWDDAWAVADEVWCPARFVCDAVKATGRRAGFLPLCVAPRVTTPLPRQRFGLRDDRFVFLFMFDALSVPERKNPTGLIEAFARALPRFHRPATLAIKVINSEYASDEMARVEQRAAALPDVLLMREHLPREEVHGLLAACDCYVSLHRSEGFGLTMAEAMAIGKPVIATGWSANTDFMDDTCAMLVRVSLRKLERDHGPYAAGSTWAEPDTDHAAACMVRMVNDPGLAAELGRRALAAAGRTLAPAAVGVLLREQLAALARATGG